ncbi:MAG: hypothetical protein CM15mP120_25570 [Pseudomonadota bacterium]|nr:MAG: hypothetical protein CM15mP120_25570 [Pseudomonadota bacterium]
MAYVANHSNTLLPWYYKVSATWGGHEGSFLLWIAIMVAGCWHWHCVSKTIPRRWTRVLGVMALMNLGFICFALFTSNPFLRLIPMTPADGADLNPLLQDFGLIVHPPLFICRLRRIGGAVCLCCSRSVRGTGGCRLGALDKTWTNMAWAFLTLGITLGSWWAYYELGWGGWWFWDPVENASFMPWVCTTALCIRWQ